MVFLTILMLLITFISCDSKLNVSNTNAVRFSTEIGRKATADSEWQAADAVGIFMATANVDLDDTPTPVDARFNKKYLADTAFQTSGFTPATTADTLKWDDLSTNPAPFFDFIAYYPYVSPIADTTALSINVYPLGSGEQDTGKADFLWGRTDNVQNNTSTVHLKLDHMLSRLIVNLGPSTTVDKDAINNATGGFTVTVKGLGSETTINLNDGTLGTTDTSASIVMKDISDTLTTTERTEGKRRFEAVLIPVGNTFALDNLILEFTLSGGARAGTYTWVADSVATSDQGKIHFDKGKQHVYNMTLNTEADEVAVAAIEIEIQDWDTGDGINAPAVKVRVKSVSAGGYHTMILKTDGTLWATGNNEYGQLGVGDTTNRSTPEQVWDSPDGSVKMTDVAAVFAGETHTLILKKDGTLWATGYNGVGQLGDGTIIDKTIPVQVKDDAGGFMTGVKAVSAGAAHTMILKKDGTLWATGFNSNGQLGIGNNDNKDTPVQVASMDSDVAAVSTGELHTMILKKNGTLWATGYNASGQLGDGYNTERNTPEQVMENVAAVFAGVGHTMILKEEDGTLWATGSNGYGQLGVGDNDGRSTPAQVTSMGSDVAVVSGGWGHTIILKEDGLLWATGYNGSGELGDGTMINSKTPVQVKASTTLGDFMTDVVAVSAGMNHTIILKKDGTLWATGHNGFGQLGLGDSSLGTNIKTPEQVIF
ncbi:fimbrillin family protein [Parasphaerochaeta coccoides]|uniref:Regulator of chromosome condensation RCC1 n=1 Tax=Parasphaerochaeta coccoides (strain ATCC BAA-1237 / DSM 17374 / SPN1) TaxID=760011 RepID=F4GLB9_PARC1|nr:fimbrillin family protein [Parasphaerochaeta coccoides]AEC02951.1 regulator of chromosome condensation RCC1 [Parasphaerochaeta coccoides DSM 17374]